MRKLRTIIVDNEELAIEGLQLDLKEYCTNDVELIETFTSPVEFVQRQNRLNFDLLFLDMKFEKERTDGLKMIKELKREDFVVIITTAYPNEYGTRAWEFNEIIADLLHKPVDSMLLERAVKKAQKLLEFKKSKEGVNNLHLLGEDQPLPGTMCVYRKGTKMSVRIKIEEIKYIYADNQEKYIVMKDDKDKASFVFLDSRDIKMEELIEKMNLPESFKLVNRGEIVNGDYIAGIDKMDRVVLIKESDKKFSLARHFNDIWIWWTQKKS